MIPRFRRHRERGGAGLPALLRGLHGGGAAWPAVLAVVFAVGCGDTGPSVPVDPGGRPAGLEVPDPQSATGGENAPSRVGAPYVVLVSVDGFASRYLEQHDAPALRARAARGVWARQGMIPAFPTRTFPSHYTLATGMYPARHGIVANTFLDPTRGDWYSLGDPTSVQDSSWYRGEPIWVTSERQGVVAAVFYWVGSEAAIGGVRPSYWRSYDAGVPNDDRVDQVLEWLAYPAEYRPHLILLYFSTTDAVGHQFGPDSPEMAQAVAGVDETLSRLFSGVDALPHGDRVTLIVLSDHGMDHAPVAGRRYLADVVALDGLVIPESGPTAHVHVDPAVLTPVSLRDAVNAGLPGVRAYLVQEVPQRLHYRGDPRIGDVVLLPDSGVVVYPADDRPEREGWTHGWDNALLSMRALFFADGPSLPAGRVLEPFEAVHVYPLVTSILGLTPAPGIDGDPSVWEGLLGGS